MPARVEDNMQFFTATNPKVDESKFQAMLIAMSGLQAQIRLALEAKGLEFDQIWFLPNGEIGPQKGSIQVAIKKASGENLGGTIVEFKYDPSMDVFPADSGRGKFYHKGLHVTGTEILKEILSPSSENKKVYSLVS